MTTSKSKTPTKSISFNSENISASKQRTRRQRRTRKMIAEYKKSGSPFAKEAILADHIGLVKFYAGKYSNRGMDFDDLCQEGSLGLLTALDGFDPALGFEFSTYASHFIRGYICEYYRTKAWPCSIPRSIRDMSSQIKVLEDRLGHEPTKQDVLDFCDIPLDKVDEAMAAARIWHPMVFHRADMPCDVNPKVHSNALSLDQELEKTPIRIDLMCLMEKTLEREELEIVILHFFEDRPQREIAQHLGTHQMHVSRSIQKSVQKLGVALTEDFEDKRAS